MNKLEIFWKGKNQDLCEYAVRSISVDESTTEPTTDKSDFVSSALLEKDDKLLTIIINRPSNKETYVIKLDTIKGYMFKHEEDNYLGFCLAYGDRISNIFGGYFTKVWFNDSEPKQPNNEFYLAELDNIFKTFIFGD